MEARTKKGLLAHGVRLKKESQQLIFSTKTNDIYCGSALNNILCQHKNYRVTPHGFRHTHCSLLFEAGMSIKEVQKRLGHSDVKTTLNIYAHVTKDAERNVADRFAKYMES